MSAVGHKQTSSSECSMSALIPKADIQRHGGDVRFVPDSDIAPLYPECGVFLYSCQRRSFFSGAYSVFANNKNLQDEYGV